MFLGQRIFGLEYENALDPENVDYNIEMVMR